MLCLGALHWDLTLQSLSSVALGESNPVSTSQTPGGVAANVAVNLASLGLSVGLASRIGGDSSAAELKRYLADSGVDDALVEVDREAGSATYTTILSPEGEVVVGAADMALYDQLDKDYWQYRHDHIVAWDLWCIDSNLPQSGIAYLADVGERPRLIAVAVSPAKVSRFGSVLPGIGTLVLNLAEAGELLGRAHHSLDGARRAAKEITRCGVEQAFVTAGKEGAAWATSIDDGVVCSPPLNAASSLSGAGDAFAAAAVAAIAMGESANKAAAWGVNAASVVAGSTQATAPLSWEQIKNFE